MNIAENEMNWDDLSTNSRAAFTRNELIMHKMDAAGNQQ